MKEEGKKFGEEIDEERRLIIQLAERDENENKRKKIYSLLNFINWK